VTFVFCTQSACVGRAQSPSSHVSSATQVLGKQGLILPLPPVSVVAGQRDTSALSALTQCISQFSLASVTGIQATGTFTDRFASSPATLTFDNQGGLRLDVSATKGQTSIRMQNGHGAILGPTGGKHALTPETASGGYLPSPLLLLLKYGDAQTSVIDQGATGRAARSDFGWRGVSLPDHEHRRYSCTVYLAASTSTVSSMASRHSHGTKDAIAPLPPWKNFLDTEIAT